MTGSIQQLKRSSLLMQDCVGFWPNTTSCGTRRLYPNEIIEDISGYNRHAYAADNTFGWKNGYGLDFTNQVTSSTLVATNWYPGYNDFLSQGRFIGASMLTLVYAMSNSTRAVVTGQGDDANCRLYAGFAPTDLATNNGTLRIYHSFGSNLDYITSISYPFRINKWVLCLWTINVRTTLVEVKSRRTYYNGVCVNSSVGNFPTFGSRSTVSFMLGRAGVGNNNYTNGYLGPVIVWARSLSDSEIRYIISELGRQYDITP